MTEQCFASAANQETPKGHRLLQLLRTFPMFDSAHPVAVAREGFIPPPELFSDLLGKYFIEPLGCDVSIVLRCYQNHVSAEPSSTAPALKTPKFIRAEDVASGQLMVNYLGGILISPSDIYRQVSLSYDGLWLLLAILLDSDFQLLLSAAPP